ncbi:MAG: DUF4453 domain-containing protein [Pseudomonadota bacterium]
MRFVVALLLMAAPALADKVCAEAWFARNLIADRGGYCFGSPLGQALFDNSDCATKQPALSAADARRIALLRSTEIEWSCAVDTDSAVLPHAPEHLRAFDPVPAITGYESACDGWLGPRTFVRSGPGGRVMGEIVSGDTVMFLHATDEGSSLEFLTVMRDGVVVARGWHPPILPEAGQCEMFAG